MTLHFLLVVHVFLIISWNLEALLSHFSSATQMFSSDITLLSSAVHKKNMKAFLIKQGILIHADGGHCSRFRTSGNPPLRHGILCDSSRSQNWQFIGQKFCGFTPHLALYFML